jgi:hypothetical protein
MFSLPSSDASGGNTAQQSDCSGRTAQRLFKHAPELRTHGLNGVFVHMNLDHLAHARVPVMCWASRRLTIAGLDSGTGHLVWKSLCLGQKGGSFDWYILCFEFMMATNGW